MSCAVSCASSQKEVKIEAGLYDRRRGEGLDLRAGLRMIGSCADQRHQSLAVAIERENGGDFGPVGGGIEQHVSIMDRG